MTTRYQDAWRRSQEAWYEDPDRFTVSSPTDPSHGDMRTAPPPLMMDAPVLQSGGEIVTDAHAEQYMHLPAALNIDETPVQGQGTPADSGHGYGGVFKPGASESELGAARGRNLGAARRATTGRTVYQFFNETFFGYFTRGFEPPPITADTGSMPPVFIRGINGHMLNNGDSGRPTGWRVDGTGNWKRGDYESSNVDRDFSPPNRRHGEFKYVEPDIVTIIGDAPPPDKPDTYASPFSSLARFLPTRRRVQGMRRDPGPWDEDLVAQEPPYYPSGNDGMVVN